MSQIGKTAWLVKVLPDIVMLLRPLATTPYVLLVKVEPLTLSAPAEAYTPPQVVQPGVPLLLNVDEVTFSPVVLEVLMPAVPSLANVLLATVSEPGLATSTPTLEFELDRHTARRHGRASPSNRPTDRDAPPASGDRLTRRTVMVGVAAHGVIGVGREDDDAGAVPWATSEPFTTTREFEAMVLTIVPAGSVSVAPGLMVRSLDRTYVASPGSRGRVALALSEPLSWIPGLALFEPELLLRASGLALTSVSQIGNAV